MMGGITRRQLLTGIGALALGTMMMNFKDLVTPVEAKEKGKKWPYEKLDPAEVAEIAYNAWFEVYCAQATATGLMTPLMKKIGSPWKDYPIHSLKFGMGGMLGWGLTCGSPVAASIVMGLVIPDENTLNLMIHDLLQWYAETALPVYKPKNPRANKEGIITTVSHSPLCHISVGKWMKAANKSFKSIERRDRCARVAASVAYKTAEMLNAYFEGTYKPRDPWNAQSIFGIPAQQNCGECHGTNIPEVPKS